MGYGDDLMTTGIARELKAQFPTSKILVGDGEGEYLSPIFWHNPNIDHLTFVTPKDHVVWIKDYPTHRPYLDYQKSNEDKQVFIPHFKAVNGNLYFTDKEIETAKKLVKALGFFIVVEPNVAPKFEKNKDWGFNKWQELVDRFQGKVDIVQMGSEQKMLRGVHRIVTENFRIACAVLSRAGLFIGTEGALHHAAAALNISGVVIFGGRISPALTGYDLHTNFYIDAPDSPCGWISDCAHCIECMRKIDVQQIAEALEEKLLEVDLSFSKQIIGDKNGR